MRKKIYCSGWGAISEPVSKPQRKFVRAPTFSGFETGSKSKRTRILSFRICL
ncbi:hypothetical protein [Leptospira borgpetersenii]|uniref:hypothetical protein n=1 Tax=Leptospira borgpetersenii TaxID=174 RepID=UPI000AAC3F1B|nr:hypothetical protein [Leptospira borgpetersenii]